MNKILSFFKSFSVLRFISVALLLIINEVEFGSASHVNVSSESKSDFSLFSTWQLVLFYAVGVFVLFNCIYTLLISFKPNAIFSNFLGSKYFLRVVYFIELILFPFILLHCIEAVNETFFHSQNTSLDLWGLHFNVHNNQRSLYEQASVLDACLYVLCSLEFLIYFWKVVAIRKTPA